MSNLKNKENISFRKILCNKYPDISPFMGQVDWFRTVTFILEISIILVEESAFQLKIYFESNSLNSEDA